MAGCAKDPEYTCPVEPLYKTMEAYASMDPAARDSVWAADSAVVTLMFDYVNSSANRTGQDPRSELEGWAHSAVCRMFVPQVDSVFPSLDGLESSMGGILARAQASHLDIAMKRYVAVVWGNPKSIAFSDSVMFVALNHYLGADHPAYRGMPAYRLAEKNPDRLPYDVTEAMICRKYPYTPGKDATVLTRILYEGIVTLAKIELVPEGSMSGALGYTEDQLQWLDDHQQQLWAAIVGRRLLYDTSESTIERLVGPSPNTSILLADAPGRAGRYLGYRIIVDYLQNNSKTTLKEMLQPEFYNNPKVLMESSYTAE